MACAWCRHFLLPALSVAHRPRWIALWGLVALPFYVAAHLRAMYGVTGAVSTEQTLLFMPLTVQEMVLTVWMIARGFCPAAVSTTSELADGTLRDTPAASL